jgi:hypothetical protein
MFHALELGARCREQLLGRPDVQSIEPPMSKNNSTFTELCRPAASGYR